MEALFERDDTMIDSEIGDMNGEMSPSESESEDMKSKNAVYNIDALLDKLGDMRWPVNVE